MVFASGFHIQCLVFHRSHFSRSEVGGHELIKIYIKKFKEEANGIELVTSRIAIASLTTWVFPRLT
jgi:hypothetical protein